MNLVQNRPTYDSPAQRCVMASEARSTRTAELFRDGLTREFRNLWHHPSISAADQLAVMGNRAVATFTQHAAAIELLLTAGVVIDPADYTPPLTFTPHEDGTITIP